MLNIAPYEISVFLDVDGTIVDIAARPDEVEVLPSLLDDLMVLEQKLDGAVALISGRSIEVIDRLFHPLRLCAAGVHGAELRLSRDSHVQKAPLAALPSALRRALASLSERFPGVLAEDKGASVALHYRLCTERRVELLAAIETQMAQQNDSSLTILPGHFVFEVKRKGYDKGTALAALMETQNFAGRIPVVIGDDITDEAAFQVALAQGGRAFSVGREIKGVSGYFKTPGDVRRWLGQVAALPREDRHTSLVQTL
jgi:trehalose 6-phosphate phosphatase